MTTITTDDRAAIEAREEGAPGEGGGIAAYLVEAYGPVLSTTEAAAVLKCHPSHVRAMLNDGTLRGVRLGERWKVPAAALAELIG